jgi:hypothetical protein
MVSLDLYQGFHEIRGASDILMPFNALGVRFRPSHTAQGDDGMSARALAVYFTQRQRHFSEWGVVNLTDKLLILVKHARQAVD